MGLFWGPTSLFSFDIYNCGLDDIRQYDIVSVFIHLIYPASLGLALGYKGMGRVWGSVFTGEKFFLRYLKEGRINGFCLKMGSLM